MNRPLFVVLVCAALIAGIAAQEKPNFVGTWKLSDDAAADMFASSQMTVAQDGNNLTVTSLGQMGEFKTTYHMDGTEARSPIDFNGTTLDRVTKTTWDGNKLVLMVTTDVNGQSFDIKAIWSLSAEGNLLVEVTHPDFQGGGGPVTSKATYKKG
jgi:hypothetical protein